MGARAAPSPARAAGAAVGSVVPIIGTAIGGAVGGALGYFGGDWLGRQVGGMFGDDKKQKAEVDATGEPALAPAGSGQTASAQAEALLRRSAAAGVPVADGGAAAEAAARPKSEVSQTIQITVNAAPGMDEEALVRRIVRRLKEAGREALYDR